MKNLLPDKPSELIELALDDLAAVEADDRYKVDMDTWHNPRTGFCAVCFAGSVIAKTLNTNPRNFRAPRDYDEDTRDKLSALDEFRDGQISCGLSDMGIDCRGLPSKKEIAEYGSETFNSDMTELVRILREAGL